MVRARGKLQALVYDILPSTTAVFSYDIGYKNCHLTSSFLFLFFGVQSVTRLSQAIQIISDVCFITNHVAYASSKPKPFESVATELFSFSFLFTRGECALCLRAFLDARLLPQSYQYPNSKHWFTTSFRRCRRAVLGGCVRAWALGCFHSLYPNSKHWFMTSFLQPLPYLVTS